MVFGMRGVNTGLLNGNIESAFVSLLLLFYFVIY